MKKLLAMSLLLVMVFSVSISPMAYAAGPSESPGSSTIKVPLTAPSELVGVGSAQTSVRLKWNDNSNNETGFVIERKPTTSSHWTLVANTLANQRSYEDSGLQLGTMYDYRVKAVNLLGSSAYSNIASRSTLGEVTVLSPNGGETLTAGSEYIIRWLINGNISSMSGEPIAVTIRLFDGRDYTHIASVPASIGQYIWFVPNINLDSAKISVSCTQKINDRLVQEIYDLSDANFSITSDGTSRPVPPSHLRAEKHDGRVILTWNHSNERVGFAIERKVNDSDYEQIKFLSTYHLRYVDSEITEGTQYKYRVRAFYRGIDSEYSESVIVNTTLWAPTSLTARVVPPNNIELTWTDNSECEEGFEIEKRVEGLIFLRDNTDTVGANVTSYTETVFHADKTYTYILRAVNSTASSDNITVSVTTPRFELPLAVPVAPADLEATTLSDSEIELQWADNSSNEIGFQLDRKKVGAGGAYEEIARVRSDVTEFRDCGLSQGTAYCYRIRAYNEVGVSGFSNEANAVTQSLSDGDGLAAPHPVVDEDIGEEPVPEEVEDIAEEPVPEGEADITEVTVPEGEADTPVGSASGTDIKKTIIKLYIGKMTYYVNDVQYEMDTMPIIRQERTFLPIRFVAEPLGAQVEWDGTEKMVTIALKEKVINLWIGKNMALAGEDYVLIDSKNPNVKPFIIPPGRTMLPVRFITEQLGCKVEWNNNTREVKITYPQ